jgi:hypothetical protein
MALLQNCKVWYSTDRDTGRPDPVPPNVRLAHLQDTPEAPSGVHLVFRTRGMLAQPRVALPMVVCPNDTPQGRKNGTTCGGCGLCFD